MDPRIYRWTRGYFLSLWKYYGATSLDTFLFFFVPQRTLLRLLTHFFEALPPENPRIPEWGGEANRPSHNTPFTPRPLIPGFDFTFSPTFRFVCNYPHTFRKACQVFSDLRQFPSRRIGQRPFKPRCCYRSLDRTLFVGIDLLCCFLFSGILLAGQDELSGYYLPYFTQERALIDGVVMLSLFVGGDVGFCFPPNLSPSPL